MLDLQELLNSKGYDFDASDLSVITESIAQAEKELQEKGKEREELEKKLQATKDREQNLQAAIAKYKTALRINPIRILPSEILSHIFMEACGMRDGNPPSYVQFPGEGGLRGQFGLIARWRKTLMQVCRRWRHICIHTPQLWSAFILCTPTLVWSYSSRISDNPVETGWSLLDQRIERAGTVPLSLLLFTSYTPGANLQLIRRFLPLIPRLKDFQLHLSDSTALPTSELPDLWPTVPAMRLQTLHLYGDHNHLEASSLRWLHSFLALIPAGQLVHAEVSKFDHILEDGMSWLAELKSLEMHALPLEDAIAAIKDAPLLEKLVLSVADSSLSRADRTFRLNLPVLKTLTLVGLPSLRGHIAESEKILDNFFSPSLEQLELKNLSQYMRNDWLIATPSLSDFIKRSHFSLHTLIIRGTIVPAPTLCTIFALQSQSLVTIRIGKALDQSVLEYIAGPRNPTEPLMLPYLEKLEISVATKHLPFVSRLLQNRFSDAEDHAICELTDVRVTVVLKKSMADNLLQKHVDLLLPFVQDGLKAKMFHTIETVPRNLY